MYLHGANHRFNVIDLFLGELVLLIELFIRPLVIP